MRFGGHITGGTMRLDPDFTEFLGLLRDHDVRFLVVRGYAVAAHGHPRYTGDLDVWLLLEPDNAARVIEVLRSFGFGSLEITQDDFLRPDRVVQLGYPPLRIDLLTTLDGVSFPACWSRRVLIDIGGVTVPFIGRDDLIQNKRASGWAQDLADIQALQA